MKKLRIVREKYDNHSNFTFAVVKDPINTFAYTFYMENWKDFSGLFILYVSIFNTTEDEDEEIALLKELK